MSAGQRAIFCPEFRRFKACARARQTNPAPLAKAVQSSTESSPPRAPESTRLHRLTRSRPHKRGPQPPSCPPAEAQCPSARVGLQNLEPRPTRIASSSEVDSNATVANGQPLSNPLFSNAFCADDIHAPSATTGSASCAKQLVEVSAEAVHHGVDGRHRQLRLATRKVLTQHALGRTGSRADHTRYRPGFTPATFVIKRRSALES